MIETEEKALSLEGRQWKKRNDAVTVSLKRLLHHWASKEASKHPWRTLQATIRSESWRRSWKLWNVGSFRCHRCHRRIPATKPVEIPWNCRWNQVERETCKYLKQNNEIKAIWQYGNAAIHSMHLEISLWPNLWMPWFAYSLCRTCTSVRPSCCGKHVELTNCRGKTAGFAALAFRNWSSRSRSLQKVCLGVLASRNMGL